MSEITPAEIEPLSRVRIEPLILTMELSRAERPDDEYAFEFVPQEYHLRTPDGRVKAAKFDWDEALLQDLDKVNLPGCDPDIVQRLGDRLGDFLIAMSWSDEEEDIIGAVRQERRINITIRSAAAELYALPWELLTLKQSRQYIGELPGLLIRYEWPGTETAPERPNPRTACGRVLFVWSAAGGAVPADEHARAIKNACAKGALPFDPARDVLSNATYSALSDALHEATAHEPIAVIHVLCHGAGSGETFGLALNAEDGDGSVVVDSADMRRLLARHAAKVRAVVISACQGGDTGAPGKHLGSVAQAIHQAGVQAVIASRFTLSVGGSVKLAEALYDELLGEQASLEDAFLRARDRLVQSDPDKLDWAAIQLYAREGDGGNTRPITFRPYRGLLAFQPSHSRFFTGRDKERAELRARVEQAEAQRAPRLQIIAGASGTGKSSLALAGLQRDFSAAGGRWDVAVLRPADEGGVDGLVRGLQRLREARPPESLRGPKSSVRRPAAATATPAQVVEAARHLRIEKPERRLLLIIDQLEEIFTMSWTAAQREVAAQAIWDLSQAVECGVVLVCTIRVDFLGRCGEIVVTNGEARLRLDKVVYDPAHTYFVPQLQVERLADIIRGPAARVGILFEEGLVERILSDVGEDTTALPLLEHALDELWCRRDGARITQRAYRALGGFKGALTRTADEVLAQMSDAERAQARRLLVRMVTPAEVGGEDTRQRGWVDLGKPVDPAAAQLFEQALARLVKSRLVVAGDASPDDLDAGAWVDLAHESLIKSWPTLRRWVAEDREMLRRMADLRRSTNTWKRHSSNPRAPDYLLRGEPLDAAFVLLENHKDDVEADIRDFILKSREVEEAAARAQQERRRVEGGRKRTLALAVALWVMVCAVLIVLAYRAALRAEDREAKAESEHRRATNVARLSKGFFYLSSDPTLAAALLREVERPQDVNGWFQAAAEAVNSEIAPIVLQGHDNQVISIEESPDGDRILTASLDGTAQIFRADGAGAPAVLRHEGPVLAARWSPRGDRVLTASSDKTARLWGTDGSAIASFSHSEAVLSAVWRPDGEAIATISRKTVHIFRPGASSLPLTLKHPTDVISAAYSPDGAHLVTTARDGLVRIWDPVRPYVSPVVLRSDAPATSAIYSPDGAKIAVTSGASTVFLWDAKDPGSLVILENGAPVRQAAFSPDGTRIAVATWGRQALIHRVDGALRVALEHPSDVATLAWSAEGARIATASSDGSVRLWTLPPIEVGVAPTSEGLERPDRILRSANAISSIVWSQDGERVATASVDGLVRVWSARSTSNSIVLKSEGRVRSARFSPDGSRVAIASGSDGSRGSVYPLSDPSRPILLWDSENERAELCGWSPDGERILAALERGEARVFRADGSEEPTVLQHEDRVRAASFSPDGARVVTASDDHTARVWELGRAGPSLTLWHDGPVVSAAWSPTGDRIATASEDRKARIFRSSGAGKPLVFEHDWPVSVVAWSPDGERLATVSGGDTIRVFNLRHGGASELPASRCGAATMLWWSPDSRRLLLRSINNAVCVVSADLEGRPLLLKHNEPVTWASWSPDGSTILTTSEDAMARIFRAEDGAEMGVLKDHTDDVLTASYSQDGAWIVTGSADGTARLVPGNAPLIVALLWGATSYCPSPEERTRLLGESEESAKSGYDVCLLRVREGPAR